MALVRCACIDIGSNTTRLLVAESRAGRLREVLAQRAFTRLGSARGPIADAKVAQVAALVAAQVRMARECDARAIRIVATAAIRQAENREAFCAAVQAAAGLPVQILSGEDEARLAFAGATRTLRHPPAGEIGVVDVGGGSSELVVGTVAGGVRWSASLPVGSAALAEAHLRSDPPSAAELGAIREHVAQAFAQLGAPRPEVAYAVGGSATSLRRVVGAELNAATLTQALHVVTQAAAEEIAERYELHPVRVRVLPAGMVLLGEAARVLGCPLRIASGGLREGVVLEELAAVGS